MKKTYICQEDQHNKVWQYAINGNDVEITFGRVGGHMTVQTKSFGNSGAMDNFISKKVAEKIGKGYKLVDDEKLQKEVSLANDIGTKYKINDMKWVSKDKNKLNELDKYDSAHYVLVEILDSWSKDTFQLLLSKTESFRMSGTMSNFSIQAADSSIASAIRKYIKSLFEEVKKAIVARVSIGARRLQIGDNADNAVASVGVVDTISADEIEVGGTNKAVLSKFLGLGKRCLEL